MTRGRPFRAIAATVGWFGFAFQYWLIMVAPYPYGPMVRTVAFFSFFTMLANLLALLSLTLPLLAPNSRASRFALGAGVRTAITLYMIMTCMLFYLLIDRSLFAQARHIAADTILHLVTPALYVADWLLFVPKGSLRYRQALAWYVLPIAYLAYAVTVGRWSGTFPYPVIDVIALGYTNVGITIALILASSGVVAVALIALDRRLGADASPARR